MLLKLTSEILKYCLAGNDLVTTLTQHIPLSGGRCVVLSLVVELQRIVVVRPLTFNTLCVGYQFQQI